MYLCIEILGESAFHKFLIQSGWSGRVYVFFFNRHTGSHMRAYRTMEEYYAERTDLHKAANIWPLIANLLPDALIEPHVFVDADGKPARGEEAADASNAAAARILSMTPNGTPKSFEKTDASGTPNASFDSSSARPKRLRRKPARLEARAEQAAALEGGSEIEPAEASQSCDVAPEICDKTEQTPFSEPLCH